MAWYTDLAMSEGKDMAINYLPTKDLKEGQLDSQLRGCHGCGRWFYAREGIDVHPLTRVSVCRDCPSKDVPERVRAMIRAARTGHAAG